jgi:adenosylcobinamide-GDP ribazoletransferase
VGIAAATGAAYAIVLLARKQIGGQTGDVAGAAQQVSEIAYYLAFAARI